MNDEEVVIEMDNWKEESQKQKALLELNEEHRKINGKLREEIKKLETTLSGTTFCYDEEDHRRLKDKIVELERTIELSYVDAKETLATINYEQEAQQKEFIKYLEDEINNCTKQNDIFFVGMQNDIFFVGIQRAFKLSLQKYKEIIGGKNERI